MGHALAIIGIKVLEVLFAGGLIGSAILLILTSIEDFREVLTRDEEEEPAHMAAD